MKANLVRLLKRDLGPRLRVLTGPARRRFSGIAPRSSKDYATHIPILVALARHFRIQRVLELGCGDFSTPTFLNKDVFEDVTQLDSFETEEAWLIKVNENVGTDQRYCPHLKTESMASAIRETNVEEFDLIFVDDSASAAQRRETIKELSNLHPTNVLIAIHDFEISEYQSAAAGFEHCHIFRAFTPQTAVVWNGNPAPLETLKALESQIQQLATTVEPDDVEGWVKVFSRE